MNFNENSLSDLMVGDKLYFEQQKRIIKSRPLVHWCYDVWYERLINNTSKNNDGKVLELGSGGSFLKELYPYIITSDITDGIAEYTIDARNLPFKDDELKAIVMTHVLHHIPDVEKFFTEALRTLKHGGVISIVDVAHTPFARFFFKHFHPEPYDDSALSWNFQQKNSMLDANQALTWIVFKRDQKKFLELFPDFVIEEFEYLPWFSYLISGGVTKRNIVPNLVVPIIKFIEFILIPFRPLFALHWFIRIRKQ